MMFRAVFWVVLPYPEDSSEHHTRRRENLKSHTVKAILKITFVKKSIL
jgi:hypothetical protein